MENKQDECSSCKHFDRYYTRGVKRYNKTKYGLCCKTGESVNIHCEACEMYEKRGRSIIAKNQIRYCLSRMMTELDAMRMILEEVNNEQDMQ